MIIGICGLIGGGKGTVADMLEQDQGFIKLSFADSLKDAVSAVFGWPRDMLEGATAESRAWREQVDDWWSVRLDRPGLTPRWVLQYWGTELCRHGFHDDIWIASMERKLMQLTQNNTTANYVLPDTRFPNEIAMVRNAGGQIWRVKRGSDPAWLSRYIRRGKPPVDIHPSEWKWADAEFDHIITNDGTIDDLHRKVAGIIDASR